MLKSDNCAWSTATTDVTESTDPLTDFADDNWLLEFSSTPSEFASVITVWLVEIVAIKTPHWRFNGSQQKKFT